MKISLKDIEEADCVCDALILPFIEGEPGIYDDLAISLSSLIRRFFPKEFRGRLNEVLLLPGPEDFRSETILFTGLGKKKEISADRVRQAGGRSVPYLRDLGMKHVAISTRIFSPHGLSPVDFTEGALLGLYTFRKYVKDKEERAIRSISVLSKSTKDIKHDIRKIDVISSSVHFARDLVNTPANDMTPSHLADIASTLKDKNLSVKILARKDAQRLGMGSYLSVSKGSKEPPKFIILDYKGSDDRPLVVIGKSVTFDSGGISLKPASGMEKMKYDMAGGAAVLGIFKALAELKFPVHVVGILPATENLIGGSASRPGDVIKAINGKTIEIISTDAEGRMTLADAIAFSKRFKPKAIIDIATLTGACAIALGGAAIAMMGNNRKLLDKLRQCGDNVYERVWEMPLFEEYKEYLESDVADLVNTGGKNGSLMSSAYFLSEFAGDTPWAHLDIAGTAWLDKGKPYIPKGASGIGARLILNFIKELK